MAIVITDDKHYKDIAKAIRGVGVLIDEFAPASMSSAIENTINVVQKEAYRHGEYEGYQKGNGEGVEQGKNEAYAEIAPINTQLENTLNGTDTGGKSYYDEFWDKYQRNGERRDYMGAFSGEGWNNETFRPKYDIVVTNAMYMFRAFNFSGDLAESLEEMGVTLNMTNCTNATEMFSNTPKITRVGVLDLRKVTSATNAFAYSGVKTIDKVIIAATTNLTAFPGITLQLEDFTVEGTIGTNGFTTSQSTKLSKASITSIINALSTTTSGLSITLSLTAVESAFGSTDSEEWISLINTRSNWTINLV